MMLEQRIANAFSEPTSSAALTELIAEVEAAAIAAGEASERARERALDPTTSAEELVAARNDSDCASFSRDRMSGRSRSWPNDGSKFRSRKSRPSVFSRMKLRRLSATNSPQN